MSSSERGLVALLRIGGVLTGSALLAALLPTEWMAATHRWLGMGTFPEAPLTEYLTRSLSLLYAVHGALLLALSSDVRRHLPVIRILGWATVGFGLATTWVDLAAPMPLFWALVEGPLVTVLGCLILWLLRGLEAAPDQPDGRP